MITKELETTNENEYIRVEVKYNIGGINYFTYKEEERGYYLHVSPIKIEQRNGYKMESFTGFSGIKTLIKSVKRKSAKSEKEAIELSKEYEERLINYVLNKNNLSLKSE